MKVWKNLFKGLVRENPVLVLLLGTCPTLAMSQSVSNALGMGLAATAVLICSNFVISLLRNVIPDKVRIPCYIVVIAAFVTVVEMLMHAFLPSLYDALGTFLSLIVVNCIILGRAEMYASKNGVFDSVIDAVGMGLGFTLALFCMATVREVFGAGTFMGIDVPVIKSFTVPILKEASGGFFVFGVLIALVNKLFKREPKKEFSCAGCPSAAFCSLKREDSSCEGKESEGV
ncbi:MAG: electron transport complex subunit E [Clostridia bacterium]|nr:electron transport complex subunit E [Clostridia bacterium]